MAEFMFKNVVYRATVYRTGDAPIRSLGGRTVPDGAIGILPAVTMVVFADCHYVDFC